MPYKLGFIVGFCSKRSKVPLFASLSCIVENIGVLLKTQGN
jgi:hypothetical protein